MAFESPGFFRAATMIHDEDWDSVRTTPAMAGRCRSSAQPSRSVCSVGQPHCSSSIRGAGRILPLLPLPAHSQRSPTALNAMGTAQAVQDWEDPADAWRERAAQKKPKGRWFHVDQNPTEKPQFECAQSIINLVRGDPSEQGRAGQPKQQSANAPPAPLGGREAEAWIPGAGALEQRSA